MLGLFKKKLPGSDILFQKFFRHWYEEEDKPNIPRPDMFQIDAYEGERLNLDDIQNLDDDYVAELKEHINVTMVEAALSDFQHIIKSDKLDLTNIMIERRFPS
jgi:hypothetical protein